MKKILIILLALCLFIPVVYVYSDDSEDIVTGIGIDGVGGSAGQNFSNGDGNATTSWSNSNPKGIRISFVTATGEDLVSTDYIVGGLSGTYCHNPNPHSKPHLMGSQSSLNFECSQVSKQDISKLEAYSTARFAGVPYTFNINYRGAIASNNFSGLFDPLGQKPAGMSDNNYGSLLYNFFNTYLHDHHTRLTLSLYRFPNDDESAYLYNIFLVYEPISVVKINGKDYVGTAYELAVAASKESGGGFTSQCAGDTALCDLSSVLKSLVPCTSYLTGNFVSQMQQLKASRLLRYFTNSSYFNNKISIQYNNASATCGTYNGKFSSSDVISNWGIGMGAIWISGIGLDDGEPEEPLPPDKKYNCTPLYNVGTCINGDSISYTDIGITGGLDNENYWKHCVFNDDGYYTIDPHKESNKNSALTYYESSLGSQYCEVYCVETLTTNFASGNITVEAGSRFMWGYSYASGGRTCKTKSVNWTKFYSDLKKANQSISNSYADWKVEQQLDKITWTKSSQKDCDWGCIGTMTGPCHDAVYDPKTGKLIKEDSMNCCTKEGYQDYSYTPSKTYVSFSVSGEFPAFKSASVSTVCGIDSVPTYDPGSKENTYYKAIDYANSLVQDMKKCYTWPESSIYNTSPQATITYGDGKNYYYSGNMDVNTSYSLSNNSICADQNVSQIKGCTGNSCPSTSVAMKNCGGTDRYVEMTRTATTVFSLNDDIFRYVLKSNNLSIHRFELPKYSNSNFTTNYYDVGEPNFPVSYSIPDGVYGSMHGKGNLDLTYSNLGHLKAGQSRTDVDNILSAVNSTDYGNWRCEFNVYSKLIPDPGGSGNGSGGGSGNGPGDIRVVYRTIDLVDPFPDIDGSKRNTGSNWCNIDGDCSYNNNTVKLYINNNRGVDDYDIYSGDPMYTFILTPKIIKEIRRYNSVNSYADYTGSLDGKNYDYKCNNGTSTGKYCISDYLSYIIDITGAKNQPGSCVDDKYRNYNDTGNFEACRY